MVVGLTARGKNHIRPLSTLKTSDFLECCALATASCGRADSPPTACQGNGGVKDLTRGLRARSPGARVLWLHTSGQQAGGAAAFLAAVAGRFSFGL